MEKRVQYVFPEVARGDAGAIGERLRRRLSTTPARAVDVVDYPAHWFEDADETLVVHCPRCDFVDTEFAQQIVCAFTDGEVEPLACPGCGARVDWQEWRWGDEVVLAYLGVEWGQSEAGAEQIAEMEELVGSPARTMVAWI